MGSKDARFGAYWGHEPVEVEIEDEDEDEHEEDQGDGSWEEGIGNLPRRNLASSKV